MSFLKLFREPCDGLLIDFWCIHTLPEPPRSLPEVPKSRSTDPVNVLEPAEGGQVR